MILLIDNYDSFSYNLFQLVGEIDRDIRVIRNDELTPEEIADLAPDHIIVSPGPGRPADAGVIIDVIRLLSPTIPILGVCLGHQAICEAYGGMITYAKKLMHGKQTQVQLDTECPVFEGCPAETPVARYHSLAVDPDTLPAELTVTARTADGEIMGVRHNEYPTYGVQFHPESIMTPEGRRMLRNFLKERGND